MGKKQVKMGVYVCTYFTGPVRRINGGTYRQFQM